MSLANVIHKDVRREERYLKTIGRYNKTEADVFPRLLGITTKAVDLDGDFLGEVFMQMELGSSFSGQFFTPFSLSHMIAKMNLDGVESIVERDGFITVCEPSCGAGGMVIACARTLRDMKLNYQQTMHVTAIDVDNTAAYMAFIQLSLLHIPAVVVVGNTLTLEERERLYTFSHHKGAWDLRLANKRSRDAGTVPQKPDTELGNGMASLSENTQLTLFEVA